MFLRRIGSPVFLATLATVILFGALSWGNAQASSPAMPPESVLRQTMPMTGTMPGIAGSDMPMDHPMSEQEAMPGAMPMQPQMGSQGGRGQMMAHMTKMQGMMAKMQRMMGGMMASNTPMTGTMPMAGMMQGDMGEMMAMMGEMQAMMAEMQGMMSSEMMAGQMQGQSMQGGMMGQMPMMGTIILIAPMPMGGMMQGMGMMNQMPMMQGMNMGGMMQGMGGMMGQGAAQADAPVSASNATGEVQSGALGEIEVKVTPPGLSNIQGDTIDFTVDLNATGADLSFDLAELTTLSIAGHAMPATAWEVAYDHGHHVNGLLKFPAHMSGPVESATLTISDPEGGESLELTWPPAE